MKTTFELLMDSQRQGRREGHSRSTCPVQDYKLSHGDVVIAAITSCTNTSNPSVLMAAGLVAKKAVEKGLRRQPWVKTSLAPGSKVVTDYLDKAGAVPLPAVSWASTWWAMAAPPVSATPGRCRNPISKAVEDGDLVVSSVLSGNRNFEGRVHPQVKANWLASPPLVVAFALAGTTRINMAEEPLGEDDDGNEIYLKDIWPSNQEVAEMVAKVDGAMYRKEYAEVFEGDEHWQSIQVPESETYAWQCGLHLRAASAVLRGYRQAAQGAPGHRGRAISWPCSVTPSPPTTSAPPAPSRRTPLPASICRNTA